MRWMIILGGLRTSVIFQLIWKTMFIKNMLDVFTTWHNHRIGKVCVCTVLFLGSESVVCYQIMPQIF